jgi:transcription antitermination factor NusG
VCHWTALRLPVRREATVADRLRREIGAVVYVPRARLVPRRSSRPVIVALYCGCGFVDLDANPPWQMIRRQVNVVGFVMAGDVPGRCPSSEIDKLVVAEINGIVQLANQPPPPSGKRFAAGQRVKIRLGAFDGREARYVRPARRHMSTVAVVLLSRAIEVKVPTHALAAIG